MACLTRRLHWSARNRQSGTCLHDSVICGWIVCDKRDTACRECPANVADRVAGESQIDASGQSRVSRSAVGARDQDTLASVDDCESASSRGRDARVSSHAVVRGRQRLVPACRHERARTSHCLDDSNCATADEGFSYNAPPLAGAGDRSLWIAKSGRTKFTNDSAVHIALPPAPGGRSGTKKAGMCGGERAVALADQLARPRGRCRHLGAWTQPQREHAHVVRLGGRAGGLIRER